MTGILITALVVVAVVGIPLGILIGRNSARSTRSTPAPQGAGVTGSQTTTSTTTTTSSGGWTSELTIWALLALAVTLPVLWSMGMFTLPAWVPIAFIGILILAALFLPNKRARTAVQASLVVFLVVFLSVVFAPRITREATSINCRVNQLNNSDCPSEAPSAEETSGPARVPAGKSGSTIAPASKWSEWRDFDKTGLCFRVWTANRHEDDIRVRYEDKEGEIWSYGGGYISDVVAISFTSKIGMPVGTYYETWEKIRGQNCRKA